MKAPESSRHHGVHDRNPHADQADPLRPGNRAAAGALLRVLAGTDQTFQPGATMSFSAGPDNEANPALEATRDPKLKSWIESANDPASDFPIQNLPFGIFTDEINPLPRTGVAIGDWILDLAVVHRARLIECEPVFAQPTLNAFIALGRDVWRHVRIQLSALLAADCDTLKNDTALRSRALVPRASATLRLPIDIPGYTDFYSSKEHATNVGSMFRDPKNALLPNWSEMPIGYNGRASSVIVSGTPVRRPSGQIKLPSEDRPVFSACRKLDIELETGFIVGAGNALGEPIDCEDAESHIFGMVLLNDWSARDIQQWEYVPLGPFNAKAFATSIGPWVVTREALEPFRVHGPAQDPVPLPYLRQTLPNNYDLELDVGLRAAPMNEAANICRTNFKYMYWSSVQQLVHHASSGCAMNVGDLLGSGTISGPEKH